MRKFPWPEVLGSLIVVTLLIGCNCSNSAYTKMPDEKIENVVRIFMHEPSRYSIMIQDPNSSELKTMQFNLYNFCRAKIVADVPKNEKMWIFLKSKKHNVNKDTYYTSFELHVRSAEDINGAGWNHGKFGSGTTTVIE